MVALVPVKRGSGQLVRRDPLQPALSMNGRQVLISFVEVVLSVSTGSGAYGRLHQGGADTFSKIAKRKRFAISDPLEPMESASLSIPTMIHYHMRRASA